MSDKLTRRETEIVKLLTLGLTSPQIAARLSIEQVTVKNYLTTIHAKLGVCNRTQAVVCALHLGIVPLGEAYKAIVEAEPYYPRRFGKGVPKRVRNKLGD